MMGLGRVSEVGVSGAPHSPPRHSSLKRPGKVERWRWVLLGQRRLTFCSCSPSTLRPIGTASAWSDRDERHGVLHRGCTERLDAAGRSDACPKRKRGHPHHRGPSRPRHMAMGPSHRDSSRHRFPHLPFDSLINSDRTTTPNATSPSPRPTGKSPSPTTPSRTRTASSTSRPCGSTTASSARRAPRSPRTCGRSSRLGKGR